MHKSLRWVSLAAVFSVRCFAGELTLPTVFSDHMVLQREQPVPVWGKADPGAAITVEFAGQIKPATAGADGKWRVDLDPLTASAEPRVLKVSSNLKSEIINLQFSDVLVGEVWLCAGQSNMEWPMEKTENADAAVAAADQPQIRLLLTPWRFATEPRDSVDAKWAVCTPETVKRFSAVAYFFGRKLNQDLNVPVGLIQAAWGGTRIEPWTPPCGFEGIDKLKSIHQQTLNLSALPKIDHQTPSALYNGMLYAHIPYAIRGAIWYQGESNHTEGMLYLDKTRAMLNGWHKLWGYEFPFYFVQITPFEYGVEDPSVLPVFWETQAEIVKVIPKTGMAVASDYTALKDIHPRNKEVPGIRLALLAEANTYGIKVISTGPVFQALDKQNGALKITFDSAEGLTTRDGKAPDWFEVAGKNGVFKNADAEIKGSAVTVKSGEVANPVSVRFAWHKLATPNLINRAGLPAAAFRAGEKF